jgi:hypothetical protein
LARIEAHAFGTGAWPHVEDDMHRSSRVHEWILVSLIPVAAAFAGCDAPVSTAPELVAPPATTAASAVVFAGHQVEPVGRFRGSDYVRHTGRFEGSTSLGAFRVPYEIFAPADPGRGNGTVLFEPPHFAFGALGRETVFGRDRLFGQGYSYAAVGFGANGLNLLDPSASDAVLEGVPVESPGTIKFGLPPDEEILIQFVRALETEPFATAALGSVDRIYAYGASQTAAALLELLHAPGGPGLFDLTLLHVALWRPPFAAGEFQRIEGEFVPLSGVGRVVFVESEADLIVSESESFRLAADLPDYRVWEVAGAAHLPTAANPLDHSAVMRAALAAGDRWIREGVEPPPSILIEDAGAGEIDPVYGFPTGIARDDDLNARGGIRLPDLHVGRARYIAADFVADPLSGATVNLACQPRPGEESVTPRFASHGEYVAPFVRQADRLRQAGYLLIGDRAALIRGAARSEVGMPGSCGP